MEEAKVISDIERLVWLSACELLKDDFQSVLHVAVQSYKRQPGLDSLTRMHERHIGLVGLIALRSVLGAHRRYSHEAGGATYVSVRSRLRTHLQRHLQRHLQWHIMRSGVSLGVMEEDFLTSDLGL
jgi:hypothetical protein